MSPAPPLIDVILASTRPGRFGEKPAAWLMDRLSARTDLHPELTDLRDYQLPIFDQPAPAARTLRDYPNEAIAHWGRHVDKADGFIVVTPEYNHGYPASLKNAIDYVFPEFNRKPIAFVGYGNVGVGKRARRGPRRRLTSIHLTNLLQAAPESQLSLKWLLRSELLAPRASQLRGDVRAACGDVSHATQCTHMPLRVVRFGSRTRCHSIPAVTEPLTARRAFTKMLACPPTACSVGIMQSEFVGTQGRCLRTAPFIVGDHCANGAHFWHDGVHKLLHLLWL